MKDRIIICFDFDGVIAEYSGWKGADVFGDPIPYTVNLMRKLKKDGYMVLIWTTRQVTPGILEYLKKHEIPFDSINDNSHNPPNTSAKPIFDVFVDDRALNFYSGKTDLLGEIKKLLQLKGNVLKSAT